MILLSKHKLIHEGEENRLLDISLMDNDALVVFGIFWLCRIIFLRRFDIGAYSTRIVNKLPNIYTWSVIYM